MHVRERRTCQEASNMQQHCNLARKQSKWLSCYRHTSSASGIAADPEMLLLSFEWSQVYQFDNKTSLPAEQCKQLPS
jgi:hypothetical protein